MFINNNDVNLSRVKCYLWFLLQFGVVNQIITINLWTLAYTSVINWLTFMSCKLKSCLATQYILPSEDCDYVSDSGSGNWLIHGVLAAGIWNVIITAWNFLSFAYSGKYINIFFTMLLQTQQSAETRHVRACEGSTLKLKGWNRTHHSKIAEGKKQNKKVTFSKISYVEKTKIEKLILWQYRRWQNILGVTNKPLYAIENRLELPSEFLLKCRSWDPFYIWIVF